MTLHSDESDDALLKAFNQRNAHAFGVVYRMIYRELYLYATRLFEPLNIPSEDIIQDVMADIWKRSSVQFPTLAYIKTFCFIALKNAYKNKLKHLGHQQRFKLECKVEYEFSDDMERVELYKTLYDSLQILPEDYATVIRMYLEGWKPEEIASKLGIALQTVYNKRREAVIILRKHIINNNL
ncbi:sigma-70 family RNA polymerase sigma factor [Butyricimonas hominis]|uniref:RNA polymerase sigma factor n=1 Tax=Butyricimonas TaxID=574697 RepID=UPI00351639C4